MSKLLLAFALGLTPAITLLAVMWSRKKAPRNNTLADVAEINLRSYVTRHVPAGPDRQAALNCIDVLSNTEARHD